MRHAGLVLALLTAATHLPACAVGGSTRALRGQSGPVAWEIVDIQQELEEHGSRMRWTFSIVLKNTGDSGIAFEQVEIGSRAGGTVDSISGGMGTEPFAQRLEPGGELRIARSQSWGCPLCAQAHLDRVFADGVIVYYTLVGRDEAGGGVRVPIAIRLDSERGDAPVAGHSPSADPRISRARRPLEQRVDERRDRGALGEDDQPADQEQEEQHRRQPPPLPFPEELQELAEDPRPALDVLAQLHGSDPPGVRFSTTQSPRTSTSIPLRAKVASASAGVLTIGSPLRLKDVFISTGTPVALPKRSMSRW